MAGEDVAADLMTIGLTLALLGGLVTVLWLAASGVVRGPRRRWVVAAAVTIQAAMPNSPYLFLLFCLVALALRGRKRS